MQLIDVNTAVGPWPHGRHAELDAAALQRQMDRFHVSVALTYHTMARHYDPEEGNRRLAGEIEGFARLVPCFVLGPLETGEFGDPSRLGDRLRSAGVAAVRVFPRDHGWKLDGLEGERLMRTLEGERMAVLVDLEQTDWQELDALLARHPGLHVVVCEAGYRGLRRLLPLLERHGGLSLDISYFGANEAVEEVVRRFGAKRLLFGSGTPGCDTGGAVARLAWSGLRDAEKEEIARANASRLLGLRGSAPFIGPSADGLLETMIRGEPLPLTGVVDAHGHLGSWYAFWLPSSGEDSLVAQLDRCGVAQLALSSLSGIGPDPTNGNAEVLRAVAAHPGRLYAYLVASPHRPQDLEVLERQLDLPGVVGIKIHPETHECAVDDPRYRWALELARRKRRPILSHCQCDSPYSDPLRFNSIADDFPDVPVILAHAGVTPTGFRRSAAVCRAHRNLRVDTCGSYMTGRWIRWLVEEIGADRVLYGTDMPFLDLRYPLGRSVAAGLSPDDFKLYMGSNARDLLGLPNPRSTTEAAHWTSSHRLDEIS